jgi:hypothetical protein
VNLRWCAAAAAGDAAARLGLESPRYRDEGGTWWTVAGGRWQAWRTNRWHAADPPERVEGPASDLPAAPSALLPDGNTDDSPRRELAPAIEAAVGKIAASYHAGRLSSDAAEAALGGLYTVDADGGIWTVGVRSARWHRFNEGRWQPVKAAPDATRLVDRDKLGDESLMAVRAGLALFLAGHEPVPEAVSEPWSPPASPPHPMVWRPTHRVPPSGLSAWESPDARSQPFGSLSRGLEVEVLAWSGAWAHVSRPGGTACWVDGRLLIEL